MPGKEHNGRTWTETMQRNPRTQEEAATYLEYVYQELKHIADLVGDEEHTEPPEYDYEDYTNEPPLYATEHALQQVREAFAKGEHGHL